MSTNLISSGTTARQKVNLRTPDVMAAVQQQVESHYRSDIIEKVRRAGGIISVGDTTVRLAKQFGFCYGVERAIDLAYAARKVFKDRRLFIVGEIIHNPEVNHQIASLGIKNLTGKNKEAAARLFALARIGTPVEIASSLPEDQKYGNLVRRLDQSRDPDPPRSQMMSPSWFTDPPGPLLVDQ